MKKNRRIHLIAGILCLLAAGLAIGFWSTRQKAEPLDLSSLDASVPLAEFHGETIYAGDVANTIHNGVAIGQPEQTAEEALREMLQNMVLYEEAVRLGYEATQSEIDALMDNCKQTYANPEGKAMIDQYCEQAGLTIDEYFTIVEAQLPRTITRQKLLDAVGKQYCDEHGLTFTKVNPPQEMLDARDAYVAQLFAQAEKDITYYEVKD